MRSYIEVSTYPTVYFVMACDGCLPEVHGVSYVRFLYYIFTASPAQPRLYCELHVRRGPDLTTIPGALLTFLA
jgi:hypothetical protein